MFALLHDLFMYLEFSVTRLATNDAIKAWTDLVLILLKDVFDIMTKGGQLCF